MTQNRAWNSRSWNAWQKSQDWTPVKVREQRQAAKEKKEQAELEMEARVASIREEFSLDIDQPKPAPLQQAAIDDKKSLAQNLKYESH